MPDFLADVLHVLPYVPEVTLYTLYRVTTVLPVVSGSLGSAIRGGITGNTLHQNVESVLCLSASSVSCRANHLCLADGELGSG